MRVLVTGAAGFLGYHTAVALSAVGHDLVLVDNFSRHQRDDVFRELLDSRRVEFHKLNLMVERNWKVLGSDYDVVTHFAAVNGTRHFYERPFHVLETNIDLVRQLLAWHHRYSPEARIIWTSSSEVYAGLPEVEIPTDEETPVGIGDVFNPRYSYAVSKLAGELLIINYCRSRDVRYTIVRPHNIYGPRMGQDHVIPEFVLRILRREEPFRIYGGDQTRAFCYVNDFVGSLMAILGSQSADAQIFNLGDDRCELRILDLAERLFRIAGWHPNVALLPAPQGSVPRRRPSLEKARRILDYEPRTEPEEGLRFTYEWYEKRYDNKDFSR